MQYVVWVRLSATCSLPATANLVNKVGHMLVLQAGPEGVLLEVQPQSSSGYSESFGMQCVVRYGIPTTSS